MNPLAPLRALADAWRADAATLRGYAAEGQAVAAEKHAAELEERLAEWETEALTMRQAAAESGLAYDTLQRKLASGELPNAGRKGSPRVRRCDLSPALRRPLQLDTGEPDLAGDELAVRR